MGDFSLHFDLREFVCPCCGLDNIAPGIAVIMELIRTYEGDKPLAPNSACRCKKYNEKIQKEVNPNYIPGSSKSKHVESIAVDIPSDNPKALYLYLNKLFPDTYGIGLYSWGVHIDLRQAKARW